MACCCRRTSVFLKRCIITNWQLGAGQRSHVSESVSHFAADDWSGRVQGKSYQRVDVLILANSTAEFYVLMLCRHLEACIQVVSTMRFILTLKSFHAFAVLRTVL